MIKEKAFVLKRIKHGEADLVVHCLNERGTKIGLFAKAALKSKKRFGGGVLEPTHYIQICYNPPVSLEGLGKLTEAELIYDFKELRTKYERLELGLKFVEIVDRVSLEGTHDSNNIYKLLGHALKAAETSSQLNLLKLQFEIKFLLYQGVLPNPSSYTDLINTPLSQHESLTLSQEEISKSQQFISQLLADYIG